MLPLWYQHKINILLIYEV